MTRTDMIDKVTMLAKQDKEYCRRLQILRMAEDALYEAEKEMTLEQRDTVWDFWSAYSFADSRLLEIACDQLLQIEQHS